MIPRHEASDPRFSVTARDPDSAARTAALTTVHGVVETPAFVPLASRATVKALVPSEVADLGYRMVLGNTYHLELAPGSERIAASGGLHRFMGWNGAIITDSGGFQVFSMGHGRVADEIKGSGGRQGSRVGSQGAVLGIDEQGVRFRSYVDGSPRLLGPEQSMTIQARLGADVALAFDECTPYHASREYTASSMERTHRWLDRCIAWHADHAPAGQQLWGIVQGGTYEDLRAESAQRVAASAVSGAAVGGSLGREKAQMYEVVSWSVRELPDNWPRHLLGIGEVDDLLAGVMLGVDLFDCAVPTRLARHGMALVPRPATRWRLDLMKSASRDDDDPLVDGCPCQACGTFSRAYLAYLIRAREMTGIRLVTLHNLNFMARLMEGIREAIGAGCLAEYRDAILGGAAPWEAVEVGVDR